MTKIEITIDGKTVLSEEFENKNVDITKSRHVTTLYKKGEDKPYLIAPSAKSRITVIADFPPVIPECEFYTMETCGLKPITPSELSKMGYVLATDA